MLTIIQTQSVAVVDFKRKNNMENFIQELKERLPYSSIELLEESDDSSLFLIDGYEIKVPIRTIKELIFPKTERLVKYISFKENLYKAIAIHGDIFDVDFNTYTQLRNDIRMVHKESGKEYWINFGNFIRGGLPKELRLELEKIKYGNLFIERSTEIHNGFYDYSKSEYLGSDARLTIICPEHGEFLQTPHDHLDGHGCPKCKADNHRVKFSDFVKKAREIHGDKYTYMESSWNGTASLVSAICPHHGEITLMPSSHLNGSECLYCARALKEDKVEDVPEFEVLDVNYKLISNVDSVITNSVYTFNCSKHGNYNTTYLKYLNNFYHGCLECANDGIRKDFDSFVKETSETHSGKYKYIKPEFMNRNQKVKIICPDHGEFEMLPYNHAIGQGCPQCGILKVAEARTLTNEEFISRAKEIFPEYDYSNTLYVKNTEPIKASCPDHGEFERVAQVFLQGYGCPKCKMNKSERLIYNALKEITDLEVVFGKRFKELDNKEIDFYIPEFNLGIEYNGIAYHHSTPDSEYLQNYFTLTRRDYLYHYDKWRMAKDAGIRLISIPDFYWADPIKQEVIKSKIRHCLNMDTRIFARKCVVKEIDNKDAYSMYDINHIEGRGFSYSNAKSFGLFYNDVMYMAITIGELYDQSSKIKKLKVSRVCTLLDYTVVGGLTKLIKYLKNNFGEFVYHSTIGFGSQTVDISDYKYLGPRYFWVNPVTLEYYHRNHCQKQLLEKHFGEPLLENDTESTYMTRLGYLRYHDCGVININF